MSTRTQIIVAGNEEIKIYKHCDGYPSGVCPTLAKLLPKFKTARGWDPQNLTAHISAAFIAEDDGFYGHGLDCEWHGDIEYAYRVEPDFSVTICERQWDKDPNFKMGVNVPLEKLDDVDDDICSPIT
jgi:hypothetical protein